MNAIEMALKSMLEKMIGSFQERIPEMLQNLPPEMLAQVGQITKIAVGIQAQLDRIENQNRLITAHLNIPAETETKEFDHERRISG